MKYSACLCVTLTLLLLLLCACGASARGGGRGGGGRSGGGGFSRGSSSRGSSWFSKSSSSSSSSPSSTSSSSKGNWFTNLFRSKPATSSSSSKPNYPRQPASNPSHQAGVQPPSYGSLYTNKQSAGGHSAGAQSYGSGMSGAAFGAAAGARPMPQSGFGAFSPQSHQTSTSYHFIPIIIPHYGHGGYYYGSRAGNTGTPSGVGNTIDNSAKPEATTEAPLSEPIVYEMDTSRIQQQRSPQHESLVLAVNNMVVYGQMEPGQHLVLVIDEQLFGPVTIDDRFLNFVDEDEVTDYYPTVAPSITATLSNDTMADTDNGSMSNTTGTQSRSLEGKPNKDQKSGSMSVEVAQVMTQQWFSDVDGGL